MWLAPSCPYSLAMPDTRDVSPVGLIPEGCESWEQFWGEQHCLVLAQNSWSGVLPNIPISLCWDIAPALGM